MALPRATQRERHAASTFGSDGVMCCTRALASAARLSVAAPVLTTPADAAAAAAEAAQCFLGQIDLCISCECEVQRHVKSAVGQGMRENMCIGTEQTEKVLRGKGGRYYIINIWNIIYRYCLTKQIEQVAHLKSYSKINSVSIFCKTFPKMISSFVKLNLSINYNRK